MFKKLLFSAACLSVLGSSAYGTDYMAAFVDKDTQTDLVKLRQAGIRELEVKGPNTPELMKKNKNKPVCIDLANEETYHGFHVTLENYNAVEGGEDLDHLASAIRKIRFDVTGISNCFGAFCVLTLNKAYTLESFKSSKGLTAEEENVLRKYIPEKPHVSLYKWISRTKVEDFEKEKGSYKVFEKETTGKKGAELKTQALTDIAKEIMKDCPNKEQKKKQVTNLVQEFLKTTIGNEKTITIGEDDLVNNDLHRLVVKKNELDSRSKPVKAMVKKIMNHHAANLADASIPANNREEVLKTRLINFMNGWRLFKNLECKDRLVKVEKETGSDITGPSMKILVDGMNDYLLKKPLSVKFDRIFFSTEPKGTND